MSKTGYLKTSDAGTSAFFFSFFLLFTALSAAFYLLTAPPAQASPNYGGRILVPAETDQRLDAAIRDLGAYLERATGTSFEVSELPQTGPGITVALAEDDGIPSGLSEQLDGKCPESFLLFSEGDERLWILADRLAGLSHGIYYYLEKLGFRWYYPGPNWEIVPQLDDITVEVDVLRNPAFTARNFFGTGGFGPSSPVDPDLEMRTIWQDWQRRNRFGQQIPGYGHVGHAFSMRFEEELRENPQYRAEVDGERAEYQVGVKLCYSSDKLLELFVEDRLREMAERVERDPDDPSSYLVGADPADGGGFCRCDECAEIGEGTISDQIFYAANAVARAIDREFPGRGVSMYAYGHYADIPNFRLEPNITVTLIPYAFQRTGMSGDDMLRAWMEKIEQENLASVAPPGLYDYWSITDWGRNMPAFDYVNRPQERLRFWHETGVRRIYFESTYSSGAIGLPLYLASRLMWDPNTDTDAMIEEFYEQSFAEAAGPMRRMMERWADDFLLTTHELALSYRDLKEAYELAESGEVKARINDYVQYVKYIEKWHIFSSTPSEQEEEQQEKARELARLMWRIYPSAMIQPYRLWQLLGFRHVSEIRDYLNPTQHDATEWEDISPPEEDELLKWLSEGLEKYEPLDFEFRSFDGELVPLDDSADMTGEFSGSYSSIYSTTFYFQVPPGMENLPLEFSVRNWNEGQEVRVTAYNDEEGREVFKRSFVVPPRDAERKWHSLEIPAGSPGRYRVEVFDQRNGFHLRAPDGVPMGYKPLRPLGWVRAYFYVPEGLENLAIHNPPRNVPAELFDPDGGKTELMPGDGPLYVVEVPEGKDGKMWALRRPGGGPVRLLNAPAIFSVTPDAVLIPEDAR